MASSADLVRQAGVTYRQIDYWTSQGYLCADADNPGEGHYRTYPDDEVAVVRLVGQLTRAGLKFTTAFYMARELIEFGETDLCGLRVTFAAPPGHEETAPPDH